jgi:hypothetical protein
MGLKALGLKKYASERLEAIKDEDVEMEEEYEVDQEKANLSDSLIKSNISIFQTSLITFW